MHVRMKEVACSVLVLCLAISGSASAAKKRDAGPPPYQPPIFSFEGGRIDLLEAVRLTLANDPALLLREQDAQLQLGIAQELAGAFDLTVNGDLSWEHREQELRQSTIRGEQDKRAQLEIAAEEIACPLEQELLQQIDLLEQAALMQGVDITTDPAFDAQLKLIETLIEVTDNVQSRQALEDTRLNLIETELELSRQAAADAGEACTESRAALERIGEVPEEEEFDIGRFTLRLDKLFRSGITFSPFARGSYDSTQFIGKENGIIVPVLDDEGQPEFSPSGIPLERTIDFGGKNIEDLYALEVGFDVNLPLLRGRGSEEVAAGLNAAEIDYRASEQIVEFSASQSALNTVFAYWNLVAAQDQLAILESSVALQRQVAEITRVLIEADELPAVELSRSLAGEANAAALVENAARELIRAQLDLVRAMGLSIEGQENVPLAGEGFPEVPSAEALERLLQGDLTELGLENRLDLDASLLLAESGQVLARAAVLGLRPRFDVALGAWASARGEGSLSEATDKWVAPSWRVQTVFEKPIRNDTAKGRLRQAEAQLQQRRIEVGDLERQIRLGVVDTAAQLAQALVELQYAAEAARAFEDTVAAEFEKLRLGETTLLDAILTEQQRTQALLALLDARFQVAVLVAQLRFETGTLLVAEEEGAVVTRQSLVSLPEASQ